MRFSWLALGALLLLADQAYAFDPPPRLDGDPTYAQATAQLRVRGYEPAPVATRSGQICEDSADSWACRDRPETEACSSDGFCNYFWRRRSDGRFLIVGTHFDIVQATFWANRHYLEGVIFAPAPPRR